MTAVAATSANEIASAPVRNAPGKSRQAQASAQGAKGATSAKGVREPAREESGAKTAAVEKAQKSKCAESAGCAFDSEANQSFDEAIDMMDSAAADKELDQRAVTMPPPVATIGVVAASMPKSDDVSETASWSAHDALLPRADWVVLGSLVTGAESDAATMKDIANVPSDDLLAPVFDPVRSLNLKTSAANSERTADADLAEGPRTRVSVTSQESHWNFATSSQRISARTVETLAVAGAISTPSRLQAQGDITAAGISDADLNAAIPMVSNAQPGHRAGNPAEGGGAGQSESGGSRQANTNGATDVVQRRHTAAAQPDDSTAVAEVGFAVEAGKSPAQQVADAIVTSSRQDAAGAPATTASASPNGVLRRLDIKLDPANLGEVQVKLSLNANALTIDIVTANAETAKLLSEDRQHIDAGLRRAGYDLVDYSVAVVTNDASAAAVTAASAMAEARPSTGQNAGQPASQPQLNSSFGGLGDRGAGRNDFGQQPRQQSAERTSSEASSAVTPHGGIYV